MSLAELKEKIAFSKPLSETLADNKKSMTEMEASSKLLRRTPREEVLEHLSRINEADQRCIDEVLELCSNGKDYRAYMIEQARLSEKEFNENTCM